MAPTENAPDLTKNSGTKESSAPKTKTKVTKKVNEEKYWEVYFLDRAHDLDLEYHYLAVNGEALQITKGTTVVVPERFLTVADNAVEKKFKKGRPAGEVSRCPYRRIREATKAEYLKMKKEGTKKHKADLERQSRAAEKTIEGN